MRTYKVDVKCSILKKEGKEGFSNTNELITNITQRSHRKCFNYYSSSFLEIIFFLKYLFVTIIFLRIVISQFFKILHNIWKHKNRRFMSEILNTATFLSIGMTKISCNEDQNLSLATLNFLKTCF